MLLGTSVAKATLACLLVLLLTGDVSQATPASGNEPDGAGGPVLLAQAKSQGKPASSKAGGEAAAEPKWVIASADPEPRAYVHGAPVTLRVGLRDEAPGAAHEGGVNLEVQWRYTEASGKTRRSGQTLELGREIGASDRFEKSIALAALAGVNGEDPVHLTLILKTKGRITGQWTLQIGPDRSARWKPGLAPPAQIGKGEIAGEPAARGAGGEGDQVPTARLSLPPALSPDVGVVETAPGVVRPDLIITSLSPSRAGYRVGDTWSTSATVKNIGFATSGAFVLRAHLGRSHNGLSV